LQVSARRGESSLSETDRRLLTHLAQRAGIGIYSVRLTNHLQQLSIDLQRSRQRLVEAREEERSRLRRDLHDDLAPTLAGLAFSAGTLQSLVGRDPARARSLAHELEVSIRDTVGEIRRLVYDLRPPTLDDLGLLAAIHERAERFSAADGASGRPVVRTDLPSTLPPLPAAVEVAVYRIVQEALMNVERHAAARCCIVRLWIDGALHLSIVDDGVGLPAGFRHGVGLRSMRDRAEELGGRFVIGPGEKSGTSIRVWFPLQGGRGT
jgi:signal transduction histidine kinase